MTKQEKSWIMYDWANSAYTMTVTSTIFQIYFKGITASAGIAAVDSTIMWANANGFTSLFVAILAPILGTIADYHGFKKRFFLFFLALGVSACALLGIIPETQWGILLGIYMISAIGFSGSNIFYDAFLVDVTDDNRMDQVSTTGYALGYIGSTIPFIACMAIVMLGSDALGLGAVKITFVITAVWWLAFSIPLIKDVKQVYGIDKEDNYIAKSFGRLIGTLKNIKTYRNAFIFLIAYFFFIDGVDTIIRMATSYGSDLGIDSNSLLVILLVTQFVAFPSAIIYGKLSVRFGAKKMLFIAIAAYTLICIYAYFMKTTFDFWILAITVGLFQGGIQAISRSYFARLIPKERSNEFFGIYNIFGKFAAIMGPFLMAITMDITKSSRVGVLSLILLFVVGALVLTQVKEEPAQII